MRRTGRVLYAPIFTVVGYVSTDHREKGSVLQFHMDVSLWVVSCRENIYVQDLLHAPKKLDGELESVIR